MTHFMFFPAGMKGFIARFDIDDPDVVQHIIEEELDLGMRGDLASRQLAEYDDVQIIHLN